MVSKAKRRPRANTTPPSAPDSEGKPPNLKEQLQQWIYQRFGLFGLLSLALLGGAVTLWWNWDKVKEVPGVSALVVWWSQQPLPHASATRFSVAIAHLEHDKDHEHEHLIVEALQEQFKEIELLRFDRTISLEGTQPEEQVKVGHHTAQEYLKHSGATALIWGTVLRRDERSLPKLYWTAANDTEPRPGGKRYEPTSELGLPEVFWEDLVKVLSLLMATENAKFRALEGQFISDQLGPFIEKVRTLLKNSVGQPGWNTETHAQACVILADSLTTLGAQTGTAPPLEEAVGVYRSALTEYTRERALLDWALTQNNLGNALAILGEREASTQRLEGAVAAYRAALTERTRERAPLDWAVIQNNLGNVLQRLGEREASTQRLEGAVAAYRAALTERTRERVPLDWAMTQTNLGNALRTLGEREASTQRLEDAVAAFQTALTERTRERVPLDWAETQNNLGIALATLGEWEASTQRLEGAVTAFRATLTEWTQERVPLDWAMTQNNLGNALRMLGEREAGTQRLEEAVTAFRAALTEWTQERVPLDWAATQTNLGLALMGLGEREAGTQRLEDAVAAYRAALTERTRERVPLDWAMTQTNLGTALRTLGERKNNVSLMCDALASHASAWQVLAENKHPATETIKEEAAADIAALKQHFESVASQDCLGQHAIMLQRMWPQETPRERLP